MAKTKKPASRRRPGAAAKARAGGSRRTSRIPRAAGVRRGASGGGKKTKKPARSKVRVRAAGGRKPSPASRPARAAASEPVEPISPRGRDTVGDDEARGEPAAEAAGRGYPGVDGGTAPRGRYVYCIIRASMPLRFGAIGIDDEWTEVYTINFRDMAAVVSDVPIVPLDSTRENVLAHERVNESVMKDHTVIPMSFGTIFKTRDDIVELLRSAYDAFADVLSKMEDKLEFGLKVLWDRDDIVRAIEQEDEDIHRLKREISSQQGSTYFARMQYGRLIDAALQQRSERYVAEFLQRLRDVSVASRVNRAIGDKMIMNAAFLVHRDQEPSFDRRIKEIAAAFDKLTFKYTGPWPPYNFVNIRLKLERAGQH
jgi:hypothetical protein